MRVFVSVICCEYSTHNDINAIACIGGCLLGINQYPETVHKW
jgi:hypothetical protein